MGRLIAIPLLGGIAALSFALLLLGYEINADLKEQLEEAQFLLDAERLEYESRLALLNVALKEREQVNEQYCRNSRALHEALEKDSALASTPVSDLMRMRLQWREYENADPAE